MKRAIATFLLLAAAAVHAQGKGKLELGLNTGLNFSTVSNDEYTSDTGYGVNFGVSADYYFSPQWSVKVKVNFDQKNWDNDLVYVPSYGQDFRTDYRLNYVTVPVLASWHFAPRRNWYLHFGPYFGFLTDASETRFGSDQKSAFNKNDLGLEFGVGVKIPVNNKFMVFFEFDEQGGFRDIARQNDFSALTTSRGALNVGINFLAN